jgi:hypothetical protein
LQPFPPNRQTQGQPKETERGGDWERKKTKGTEKQRNDTETRSSPTIVYPFISELTVIESKTRSKGDANSAYQTKAQRREPTLTIVFTIFINVFILNPGNLLLLLCNLI